MANHTNIPFLLPIKIVPETNNPGLNFDDDWAYNQIKPWQKKVCYRQKWQFGDTTRLHITSTIPPTDLQVYNTKGVVVKTIPWLLIADSGTDAGKIFELDLQLDDDGTTPTPNPLPAGVYFTYWNHTNGGSYNYPVISEPIDVRAFHPNTSIIKYTHSENDFGCFLHTTKAVFTVRIEAQLLDFLPKTESADYIDQIHNATILSSSVWREFKLKTGTAKGQPDFVADMMARIFVCDSVKFNNKLITKVSGAQWEPQRSNGYPLSGWALDVTESKNLSGLQYNDVDPLVPGVVTLYDMNTDLFGGTNGANIHVIDKEFI